MSHNWQLVPNIIASGKSGILVGAGSKVSFQHSGSATYVYIVAQDGYASVLMHCFENEVPLKALGS